MNFEIDIKLTNESNSKNILDIENKMLTILRVAKEDRKTYQQTTLKLIKLAKELRKEYPNEKKYINKFHAKLLNKYTKHFNTTCLITTTPCATCDVDKINYQDSFFRIKTN